MAWLLRPPGRAYLVLLASVLRTFRGSQRRKIGEAHKNSAFDPEEMFECHSQWCGSQCKNELV